MIQPCTVDRKVFSDTRGARRWLNSFVRTNFEELLSSLLAGVAPDAWLRDLGNRRVVQTFDVRELDTLVKQVNAVALEFVSELCTYEFKDFPVCSIESETLFNILSQALLSPKGTFLTVDIQAYFPQYSIVLFDTEWETFVLLGLDKQEVYQFQLKDSGAKLFYATNLLQRITNHS